jgi:transposase InsO family protein
MKASRIFASASDARPPLEAIASSTSAMMTRTASPSTATPKSPLLSRELDPLDFSRPGKPTDNAFIESFNGKFRAECLNANWFLSHDEARAKCEAWRRDYNGGSPSQRDRQ